MVLSYSLNVVVYLFKMRLLVSAASSRFTSSQNFVPPDGLN